MEITSPPPFTPLTPQSSSIPFSEWISLLTLLLAPIIAHVAAGVPPPTYLTRSASHRRPKWHDHIPHYNPLSILYRYAAITNRRLLTPSHTWTPLEMSTANAIFWTPSGWDGTLPSSYTSQFATHLPKRGYTSLLSWEFLKTAIVTLQGVQVMYVFAGGFVGEVRLPSFAVDTISFPIAILGLMRLWPAFWLTDDFSFGCVAVGAGKEEGEMSRGGSRGEGGYDSEGLRGREDGRGLLGVPMGVEKSRVRETGYWPSRVFRFVFALPLIVLLPIAVLTLLPGPWHRTGKLSMTAYLGALLSTVNLFVMTVMYGYYAVRDGCRSTIIPCISATWYKIMTGVFWAAALGLVVVSAIETRRTPCGSYTTAGKHMDAYYCPGLVTVGGMEGNFGVARWTNGTVGLPEVERREFEVLNFVGSCQGVIGESSGFYNVSA